jgi:hypothetical protein
MPPNLTQAPPDSAHDVLQATLQMFEFLSRPFVSLFVSIRSNDGRCRLEIRRDQVMSAHGSRTGGKSSGSMPHATFTDIFFEWGSLDLRDPRRPPQ